MKVYIDWDYDIHPYSNNTWIKVNNANDSDIIVSINTKIPYILQKPQIFWLYEPESIIENKYKYHLNQSNIIATHRTDLNFKNKIVIPPCFPSWIDAEDRKIYNKTKLISMIASVKNMCTGHSFRQIVANTLSDKTDLYGFGRKNELNKKIDGLKDYMFSVAMENVINDGYYTEKLLDCFLTGTIPIYWGTEKILNIFDKDGILFLNSDGSLPEINEEIYRSKEQSIKNNFNIALKNNLGISDGIQLIHDKYYKI